MCQLSCFFGQKKNWEKEDNVGPPAVVVIDLTFLFGLDNGIDHL